MRDQRGHTAAELAAALTIIALLSSMAILGGVGFISSAKKSKAASEFANNVSIARTKAISRYEQWRINFPTPAAGSDVVTSYTVESCTLAVGTPGTICSGPWVQQGQPVELEPGMGLKIPLSGGVPEPLYFDRTGLFLGSTTEIQVCQATTDAMGVRICRPGSTGRLIRIRGFSGIIET